MTEIDDHVHECEISFTRSQVYGLLARIFSSSDQVLDNTLLRDLGRVTSETSDYVELDDDLTRIKEAIRAIAPTVREMNQEYTRLFSKGEAPLTNALTYPHPESHMNLLISRVSF